ncbi:MAG: DNA polymerase IV [Chloroflexi bacterium]|nr:DNA polymerase IV [Chloroflexota bacterium]
MTRIIFHVDLDAFFVAVERVLDPSLIGKPVVVGGAPGHRGVVMSASYEARRYGVRSAMPAAEARRLCPQALFVPGKMHEYRKVSARFMDILRSFTPLVEQVSVDEAYLDMAGTVLLSGPPETAAKAMRARIASDLRVTASIGVAESKLVAKVASDECKPDGLLVVPAGGAQVFLSALATGKLPGLGPRAEQELSVLGIRTLGQLAEYPFGPMARRIGEGPARLLKERARGIDDSPVVPQRDAKSISAETTFGADSSDTDFLRATLLELAERVGTRLRRSGKHARSISLKLRYYDFTTITRQKTLPRPVEGDDAIFRAATELMEAAMRARRAKVRLLGVGVDELTDPAAQLSLLAAPADDDSKLGGAVDRIRDRFGRDSIKRAAVLRAHRR